MSLVLAVLDLPFVNIVCCCLSVIYEKNLMQLKHDIQPATERFVIA